MKSLSRTRFLAAAALALGALGAASAAHARSDVYFSVGVEAAPGVVLSASNAPVYVQPAPVYVQPAPVYVQPRPVYAQPPVYGYSYEDERARRHAEWRHRQWMRHHYGWDQHHSRAGYWD